MPDTTTMALINSLGTGLSLVGLLVALLLVLILARGRARAFGAAGIAVWLLSTIANPLAYLLLPGLGPEGVQVGSAAINTVGVLVSLAGLVLVVKGLLSRDGHRALPAGAPVAAGPLLGAADAPVRAEDRA